MEEMASRNVGDLCLRNVCEELGDRFPQIAAKPSRLQLASF